MSVAKTNTTTTTTPEVDTSNGTLEISTNTTVPNTSTNSTTTPIDTTDPTIGTNSTTPITDGDETSIDDPKTNTTETDGGDIKVDPALEESRQTCIATCTLKCKSEAAEKKDACIDLCFNQCTASIALVSNEIIDNLYFVIQYVQEKERPLLRIKQQTLMSLSQENSANLALASYYDESTESRLRMDEFMQMKIE